MCRLRVSSKYFCDGSNVDEDYFTRNRRFTCLVLPSNCVNDLWMTTLSDLACFRSHDRFDTARSRGTRECGWSDRGQDRIRSFGVDCNRTAGRRTSGPADGRTVAWISDLFGRRGQDESFAGRYARRAAARIAIHAGCRYVERHAAQLYIGRDTRAWPALVRSIGRTGKEKSFTSGNRAIRHPYGSQPDKRRTGYVLARSPLSQTVVSSRKALSLTAFL